jgi:hypothetical protein
MQNPDRNKTFSKVLSNFLVKLDKNCIKVEGGEEAFQSFGPGSGFI